MINFLPGILLAIFTSTLIGLGGHLWRGGSLFRMIASIVFSWVGFFLGQLVGSKWQSSFFVVGWLQMGWGIIFSIIAVIVGAWLMNIKVSTE